MLERQGLTASSSTQAVPRTFFLEPWKLKAQYPWIWPRSVLSRDCAWLVFGAIVPECELVGRSDGAEEDRGGEDGPILVIESSVEIISIGER